MDTVRIAFNSCRNILYVCLLRTDDCRLTVNPFISRKGYRARCISRIVERSLSPIVEFCEIMLGTRNENRLTIACQRQNIRHISCHCSLSLSCDSSTSRHRKCRFICNFERERILSIYVHMHYYLSMEKSERNT